MIVTLPFSVWMLVGYFKGIPVELEEAAIIDSASRLGILFRITLPLSVPGIVAVVVYSFVTTWNEFIFALSFALDSRVKALPIGLSEFSTEFNTDWGAVMAASVIMTPADRHTLHGDAENVRRRAHVRRGKGIAAAR